MKNVMIILQLLVLVPLWGHGQTWSEWFSQKKTQKKYLIEQIAALKVYMGFARKGYQIAEKGLNGIAAIKDGEFSLHQVFFNSLSQVSPAIRKDARAKDIVDLHLAILDCYYKDLPMAKRLLTVDKLAYIQSVYQGVLSEADKLTDELEVLLTSGAWELTDKERLVRLGKLKEQMLGHYHFCKTIGKEVVILSRQKTAEGGELTLLEKLYGLKNDKQ